MSADADENLIKIIDKKLEFIQKQNEELEKSLDRLYRKAAQYKARFKVTPSIWPINGRIMSDFGWRNHPVFGNMRFHSGMDISSYIGAPIRAGADGIVKFAGWQGGYGLAVIIDHGYGYQTIYGHTSKIYVVPGQRISKGQLIAAVGSTGISTGPHLHYEIRLWNTAINPRPYLNLDLFTAARRLW